MAADCFWCVSKVSGSVPAPVGNPGEALGCCVKCQVFACGHHAIRNAPRQEFKCYKCLVLTLINNSLDTSNLTSADKKSVQQTAPDIISFDIEVRRFPKYDRYKDFETSTPELKPWFPAIREIEIDWTEWPKDLYQVMKKLSDDELLFLKAAGFILHEIEGKEYSSGDNNPFFEALLNSIKINAFT